MRRRLVLLPLLVAIACGRNATPTTNPEPTFEDEGQADDDPSQYYPSQWTGGVVQGTVALAPNAVEPPEGFTMELSLWGGPDIVATKSIALEGPSPWAYEIAVPEDQFDPEKLYSVSAMVNDPTGQVWYTEMPVRVFERDGEPGPVELVLDPVDARAAKRDAE